MTGPNQTTTVGQLPSATSDDPRLPATLTRLVWVLWALSLVALVAQRLHGEPWTLPGLLLVDGLTVLLWLTVTFLSGIVHSYARRYMAGHATIDRFFRRVFAFTVSVLLLVAADHLLMFVAAWTTMGLLMADLIGHVREWPQAAAAASLARRYFLTSAGALTLAVGVLWWQTGSTTVSGLAENLGSASSTAVLVAAGALLLAAMIQSALLPFHGWLLSSMTAPTPASALMHAGFVNAGGILLVRFAPVVSVEAGVMLLIAAVGAASAMGGKLLKTVRTDVKGKLGCSTVGQMGFMLVQAGLGFFAAAITHLILHGFYKAYRFLGSGSQVTHQSPAASEPSGTTGPLDVIVIAVTALAGGGLFVAITGKGTKAEGGFLLTLLVVLTVLHAARELAGRAALPGLVRYGAVPGVALPAIALYGLVYRAVAGLLTGLPAVGTPIEVTPVHGVLAVAFLAAYLVVDTGLHRRSDRLYVWLLNATQPRSTTQTTAPEDYNEY